MATQIVKGKDGEIELDGAAIGNITGWNLEENIATNEVTVIGDDGRQYESTLLDWTGRADALYHPEVNSAGMIAVGDRVKLRLHPEGQHLGVYREGTCIVDNISQRGNVGTLHTISFSFRGSGKMIDNDSGGTQPPVGEIYGWAGAAASLPLDPGAIPSSFTRFDFAGNYDHRIQVNVPQNSAWTALVPTGREPGRILYEGAATIDGSVYLSRSVVTVGGVDFSQYTLHNLGSDGTFAFRFIRV